MFRLIAEMIVRSNIKKQSPGNEKHFLPWDGINKIALIISSSAAPNKSAIDKFIADSQKYIEVFYVELSSKQASYADWHCLTKKDASFLKLPKSKVAEDLKRKALTW